MRQTLLIVQTLAKGPGPLRRRIAAQQLLLQRELELTGAATRDLKEAVIATATSPLVLAASCVAGFASGLLKREPLEPGLYVRALVRQATWPLLITGAQKLLETFQHRHADVDDVPMEDN
jgi:hypothetical protein